MLAPSSLMGFVCRTASPRPPLRAGGSVFRAGGRLCQLSVPRRRHQPDRSHQDCHAADLLLQQRHHQRGAAALGDSVPIRPLRCQPGLPEQHGGGGDDEIALRHAIG